LEEQPHELVAVLQAVPRELPAQSAAAVHPQAPVATSHTGPVALAEQSEFLLQRFSHWTLFEDHVGQSDPAGQSPGLRHPHLFFWTMPAVSVATRHRLPELEDTQSEAALHPHACVSVLQRAPSALFAQSALVLQPAEASPVVASVPPSPRVVVERPPHPHRANSKPTRTGNHVSRAIVFSP
jgi:hypothetical protein